MHYPRYAAVLTSDGVKINLKLFIRDFYFLQLYCMFLL